MKGGQESVQNTHFENSRRHIQKIMVALVTIKLSISISQSLSRFTY